MTAWMQHAWAELGQLEVSGSGANPAIIGYFKAVQRDDILSDEVAWCGAFVGAALLKGGIALDAIKPAHRLLANSYLKIGVEIKKPRIGCIVVLSRGSNPAYGHVGFVVGITPEGIHVLGGNQANSVSVQFFPFSRVRGYRWPEPVPTSAEIDSVSRIAKAQKQIVKDTGKISVTQPTAPLVPDVAGAPALPDIPSPDALAAKATGLQTAFETAMSFGGFLANRWPWVMAAMGAYWLARIGYNAYRSRQWRTDDAASGKTPAEIPRPPIEPEFDEPQYAEAA